MPRTAGLALAPCRAAAAPKLRPRGCAAPACVPTPTGSASTTESAPPRSCWAGGRGWGWRAPAAPQLDEHNSPGVRENMTDVYGEMEEFWFDRGSFRTLTVEWGRTLPASTRMLSMHENPLSGPGCLATTA